MFNFRGKYPDNFVKDGAAIICKGRVDVYDKGRVPASCR
jgi:hypothetical protein